MEAQRVDMFIMTNGKYFKSYQLNAIRDRLIALEDSRWAMISTVQLKDPAISLVISILVGHFGVDRMIIGDVGLGIVKLLTCGGMGVWTVVDWFSIMGLTRQKNMEQIQPYLY